MHLRRNLGQRLYPSTHAPHTLMAACGLELFSLHAGGRRSLIAHPPPGSEEDSKAAASMVTPVEVRAGRARAIPTSLRRPASPCMSMVCSFYARRAQLEPNAPSISNMFVASSRCPPARSQRSLVLPIPLGSRSFTRHLELDLVGERFGPRPCSFLHTIESVICSGDLAGQMASNPTPLWPEKLLPA